VEWSVCRREERVTILMGTTIFLNTSCHRHLRLTLFPTRAGGWTDVFRIQRSVKFLAPNSHSLTASRGVRIILHRTERYLLLSVMRSHLGVFEQG
jgi:hypothetical protein